MKKYIVPIVVTVLLLGTFKTVNPSLNAVGALLAILLGFGIGFAINSIIFKVKKKEVEVKEELQH